LRALFDRLADADVMAMRLAVALPRRAVRRVRSAAGVVALVAVVALAVHLVLGSTPPPPGLSEALSGSQAPPVSQTAATRCFRASPAVKAVRSAGTTVLVRFVGRPRFMKLEFFPSADDAVRYSYAHGSPNSFYDNTIWSQVPAKLTHAEIDALSTCLPMPMPRP
jgi:hypothetical protein